jgi:hypothetical protein
VALAAHKDIVQRRAAELTERLLPQCLRQASGLENLLLNIFRLYRYALDLSSVQLDGSHTLTKNGGAATGAEKRVALSTPYF